MEETKVKLTREDIIKKIEGRKSPLGYTFSKENDLSHLDLSNLDLSNLDLSALNFCYSDLYGVNFSNSNLTHSVMVHTKLANSNFTGANLTNVNMSFALLLDSNMENAILNGTRFHFACTDGITGKKILTFIFNRHHAYYVDGILTIGCTRLTPKEWLKSYKMKAKWEKYTKLEIKMYKQFIKICKKAK